MSPGKIVRSFEAVCFSAPFSMWPELTVVSHSVERYPAVFVVMEAIAAGDAVRTRRSLGSP